MSTRHHSSSSKGLETPETTMLGRKFKAPIGFSKWVLMSWTDSSDKHRMGKLSANAV